MAANMRNAGVQPGVSRNQLVGWLLPSLTATEWQAQLLASRFVLSPPLARDVARLWFGEGAND